MTCPAISIPLRPRRRAAGPPFRGALAAWRTWWRSEPEGGDAEARLVAAAKYGDPEAFEALVDRYGPRLHAVARRMVGDDLAADVVQDAFLAAFRSLGGYRGTASFSTYLHTIVVNRCRRVGARRREHMTLDEGVLPVPPDRVAAPERHAEASQTREAVEEALRALPPEFRETLALREFSELPYGEIAEVLGVSVGTVKSRIARGRALLRTALEQVGVRP